VATRDVTRTRLLSAGLEARALATEIPSSLRRILRRAASNDFRVGLRLEGAEDLQSAIQKIASRITLGLITAALIIGSALLLNVQAGITLWGYPVFALVGFLLAAGLGIYLVVKIIVVDRY
jgi:ubiquinone biosynthesis protein